MERTGARPIFVKPDQEREVFWEGCSIGGERQAAGRNRGRRSAGWNNSSCLGANGGDGFLGPVVNPMCVSIALMTQGTVTKEMRRSVESHLGQLSTLEPKTRSISSDQDGGSAWR